MPWPLDLYTAEFIYLPPQNVTYMCENYVFVLPVNILIVLPVSCFLGLHLVS